MTNEQLRQFIANVDDLNPGKFKFSPPPPDGYPIMFFAYDRSGKWDGEWGQSLSVDVPEHELYENFHRRFWDTVFPRPGRDGR